MEIGEHCNVLRKILCIQKHENQRRTAFTAQQDPHPKHWIRRLSCHHPKLSFLEKHHSSAKRNNRNTNTFLVILNENIGCDAHTCFIGKPFVAALSPLVFPYELAKMCWIWTRIRCLVFGQGLCSTVLFRRAFFVVSSGHTDS